MNTVTLDNALYDDVANIARWSNTSVNDIVSVLKEIHALANLEENWDGYGAVPVLKTVIDNAEKVILNEVISVKYLDDIQPNPNDTVTMTWTHKGNSNILKLAAYVNQL